VEKKKGSHGIVGMSVKFLRRHLYENWDSLRASFRDGTYKPKPIRRIEIPKPNGGVRLLSMPTVKDRFIQQAIIQVLPPLNSKDE
jgi:RNA-directed DNA polymerase